MAVANTIQVQSAAWNSVTYSSSTSGMIRFSYNHSATAIKDRTGDDAYPTYVGMVDKELSASITIRDVKFTTAIGTKSNLVLTLTGKSTVTITLAGMVLESYSGAQERANTGECTLNFVHESSDGSTVPVS